jgi:hypothetical protein
VAGGAVPDQDPLHLDVAAVPHRQRLGGFLPTISFALVAATGNIYYGLWYPIVIALMTSVIGSLFLRETYKVDITK